MRAPPRQTAHLDFRSLAGEDFGPHLGAVKAKGRVVK